MKPTITNEDAWSLIDELEPEEKVELLDALAASYRGLEDVGGKIKKMWEEK